MNIMLEKFKLEKLYANLFFLFFTAQILSPYILGKTFYLEICIAALNPFFWSWLKSNNNSNKIGIKYIFVLICLFFIAICGHIDTAVKLIINFFLVVHLFYIYNKNLWKLEKYMVISIILAIFQFYFSLTDPNIAGLIGPSNIANIVWGDFATPTYTNFFTVFLFPRVSGLSREAGFFASLISVIIFFHFLEKNRIKNKLSIIYWIGYIISFSKMSFVLFLAMIIDKAKKIIIYIPTFGGIILFIMFMSVFSNLNKDFILDDATFLHRMGGYISLFNLNFEDLLLGINSMQIGDIMSKSILAYDLKSFAGLSGWIISNGIIVAFIFFLMLYFLNINIVGMLILLAFTLNVSPDSNQNFVVLTYFIIFKYYTSNDNRIQLIKNIVYKNRKIQ